MVGHRPKKRFGQHFLYDKSIIQAIVDAINPNPHDHLVEIGPGLGAITLPLLPYVLKIDAIELDRDIIPQLKQKALGAGELIIHQQDALLLDLKLLSHTPASLRIVGNLPYNISTPLLFHLFNQKLFIIDMHFMVQKEVGNRLIAKPGSKHYGRLSVMAQYHCQIEPLIFVPPSAFKPKPKVDSMFIRLIPLTPTIQAKNNTTLNEIVKQAFSHRRKTISNALKPLISKEQLEQIKIDPGKRPEELSVEMFVILSNLLEPN
jgi:16S rRNA (adenine1518-N6/adenine1519-N6)-dimethyltransferase